jgi:hypothetical protein
MFWLSAAPSGRAVWIGICGELGSNSCKRDWTVCSPRTRCDYIFAQHVRISYLRVWLQPLFLLHSAHERMWALPKIHYLLDEVYGVVGLISWV